MHKYKILYLAYFINERTRFLEQTQQLLSEYIDEVISNNSKL